MGQMIAFGLAVRGSATDSVLGVPWAFWESDTMLLFNIAILYVLLTYSGGFLFGRHDKYCLDSLALMNYSLLGGDILEVEIRYILVFGFIGVLGCCLLGVSVCEGCV